MAIQQISMPRLGETMESARLVRWHKRVGDHVCRGEVLLEVETDKTVAELPSLIAGTLIEQLAAEGQDVVVGQAIAIVDQERGGTGDSSVVTTASAGSSGFGEVTVVQAKPATVHPISSPSANDISAMGMTGIPDTHRQTATQPVRATPAARRLARVRGVPLVGCVGSGRRGRIETSDIDTRDVSEQHSASVRRTALQRAGLRRGEMVYTETGDSQGERVVLVHGFAGDHQAWAALTSELVQRTSSPRLRLWVPDLPAHGATDMEASCIEDLVDAVLDALASSETEQEVSEYRPIHWVGHSMGAIVATRAAMRWRQRTASLSLIAPAGMGREIAADFVLGMAGARSVGELAHLLTYLGARANNLSVHLMAKWVGELAKGRLHALAEAVVGPTGGQALSILHDLRLLCETGCPVQALVGQTDRVIPAHQAMNVPSAVAVHFLSECGHMPQWDQPALVAQLLRTFVTQHGRSRSQPRVAEP